MKEVSEEWMPKVNGVLKLHGGTRKNGKVASERTQTITKEVVYAIFRKLHELGYKIKDPRNLSQKHVEVLVNHWWREQKKSPKTIEGDLSRLRRFCEMMGKVSFVKRAQDYLPDVDPKLLTVKSAALEGKSLAANGIDVVELFERIDRRCLRLGAIMRVELAFGIRREEALKCRPHTQGYIGHYAVLPGQGKGGRHRNVIRMTEAQGRILEYVKSVIPKGEACGWRYTKQGQSASLEQNIVRYKNEIKALGLTKKASGVTGHSFRAQFAENNALAHGLLPPSLGGTKGQMDKAELKIRVERVSQDMGHNRERVMASYYCAFSRSTAPDAADRSIKAIEACLPLLPEADLLKVPVEHQADCEYIRALMYEQGLEMLLRQVHVLWSRHSRRNGVEWMKPEREIALALEAQANELLGATMKPRRRQE